MRTPPVSTVASGVTEERVATQRYCASRSTRKIEPTFILSKETPTMDTTSKTALVIALVVVGLLLLLFGGGMATGTSMSGGMMGTGSMGGISWMWLPTLLVVVLGVVLFSFIFGKK